MRKRVKYEIWSFNAIQMLGGYSFIGNAELGEKRDRRRRVWIILSEENTVRGISDHSREYQPPIPVWAEKDRGKVWNMDHMIDGPGETQGEL